MTATLAPTVVGSTKLYLADADPKSAAEIISSVEDFYRDFSLIAPTLEDVKLGAMDKGSYAYTRPESLYSPQPPYHIVVNPLTYGTGSRQRLERSALEDCAAGFHRYWEPRWTFEHELGHVVDFNLAVRAGTYLPLSSNAHMDAFDAMSVSEYGFESGPAEVFADAFALWRSGVNPGSANIRAILRDFITQAGGHYVDR